MPDESREGQYDLLTAAVLGVAVGAGLMMLVSGGRKSGSTLRRLRRKPMARVAAMAAGKAGREGARWAARRAREMADAVDPEGLRDQLGDYVSAARDQIDHAVATEVRDLKRAIRRQRRKLGI